jgi:hypothetical protein
MCSTWSRDCAAWWISPSSLSAAAEGGGRSRKVIVTPANNRNRDARYWASPQLASKKELHLDCTFNSIKLSKDEGDVLKSLYWKIDSLLVFNDKIMQPANRIIEGLKANSEGYTALHYRIEDDWVTHCKTWEVAGSKKVNCLTNTDVISNVLRLQRVPASRPLYIAGAYTLGFMRRNRPLSTLMKHYHVVTKDSFLNASFLAENLQRQREVFAAIDYAVCAQAALFVGNSVSTFSATLELRRLGDQRPVFHYNGGSIPLATYTPLLPAAAARVAADASARPLKWVFSLTLKSEKSKHFLQMAKVAVASAIANTSLDPVCLLHIPSFNKGAPWVLEVMSWMRRAGVILVRHKPAFSALLEAASKEKGGSNSPLYADYYGMIGTFMRFDIPKLGFIDEYVLYTDADVLFVGDITLRDFERLPKFLLMAEEKRGVFYGNAGVALFNTEGMRSTYDSLIAATFSQEAIARGLDFGRHGPLDQGALNQFYRNGGGDRNFKKDIIAPDLINHRPYWGLPRGNKSTSLVHFHGPKPADYAAHRQTQPQPEARPGEEEGGGRGLDMFRELFAQCDALGDSCYRWVDAWFRLNDRIESGGYAPRFGERI